MLAGCAIFVATIWTDIKVHGRKKVVAENMWCIEKVCQNGDWMKYVLYLHMVTNITLILSLDIAKIS